MADSFPRIGLIGMYGDSSAPVNYQTIYLLENSFYQF